MPGLEARHVCVQGIRLVGDGKLKQSDLQAHLRADLPGLRHRTPQPPPKPIPPEYDWSGHPKQKRYTHYQLGLKLYALQEKKRAYLRILDINGRPDEAREFIGAPQSRITAWKRDDKFFLKEYEQSLADHATKLEWEMAALERPAIKAVRDAIEQTEDRALAARTALAVLKGRNKFSPDRSGDDDQGKAAYVTVIEIYSDGPNPDPDQIVESTGRELQAPKDS